MPACIYATGYCFHGSYSKKTTLFTCLDFRVLIVCVAVASVGLEIFLAVFWVPLPAGDGAFDHFQAFAFLYIVNFKIFSYLFHYGMGFFADYIFEFDFLVDVFLAVLYRVVDLKRLKDLGDHVFGSARLHESLFMPE